MRTTARLKPLADQTIVVTGASSGIGLATARIAAERGANVVLVARNGDALGAIASDLRHAGASVLHVAADVADREDVDRAVTAAIERFGGFDTWINDAGVDVWGLLKDISDADHRRLFETNFWGVVYGSLAAAEHLRTRSDGGALVNVGSIESERAFPLQGMYAASKHAVKGFTDAFRMEIEHADDPISVTLVMPGSVGTPLPDHAKTYLDRAPRLPRPVYRPEEAALAILTAAERPKRDIYVGGQAKLASLIAKRAPRLMDRVSERSLIEPQLSRRPAARRDNLHEPGLGGTEVGRNTGRLSRSLYTRLALRPGLVSGATAVTAAGLAAFAFSRARR